MLQASSDLPQVPRHAFASHGDAVRPRAVDHIALVCEEGRKLGLDAEDLLAGTCLKAADLFASEYATDLDAEYQVIRNLTRARPREGLGVRVGARYGFTRLGPLGVALVSSPNLRAAMQTWVSHHDLNGSPIELGVEGSGHQARMTFNDAAVPRDLRRFVVEREMAMVLSIAKDLLRRPVFPVALELTLPPGPKAAANTSIFELTPRPSLGRQSLVFRAEDLDTPLPWGHPGTLAWALAQCRVQATLPVRRRRLTERVHQAISSETQSVPSMASMAATLCMSERTLRRRLADEDTTYAVLCDEHRAQRAAELLAETDLAIAQVAERLGYAETASFIHAFRRWKGKSPRAYRLASRQTG